MGDEFVPFWFADELLKVVEEVESLEQVRVLTYEEERAEVLSHMECY